MVHRLAWELNKTVSEIKQFLPEEYARWVAFFQIQDEALKKKPPLGKPPRRRGRT